MMKLSVRCLLGMLGLLAGCQVAQAVPQPINECSWWEFRPGPIIYQANLGTVYVPRDAAIGSVIGVVDQFLFTPTQGPEIICRNNGNVILDFSAVAVAPPVHRLPGALSGANLEDKIYATNIPGIGARITLEHHFDGKADNSFAPVNGGEPIVPFDAILTEELLIALHLSRIRSMVTLYKTGPIAPGPQQVGQHMFDGIFSNIGKGFSYSVNATVIQAQCSVGANPVSLDPVPLGDWEVADFTHPGYTTTPTPFTISLTDCEADPAQNNQATAHIRLDGANGSLPEGDGSNGVFSLGNGSGARGIGIQVLRGDGITPVPLGTDVPFGRVENGQDQVLDFTARFFQTGNVGQVTPGVANGALSFTLSFQ